MIGGPNRKYAVVPIDDHTHGPRAEAVVILVLLRGLRQAIVKTQFADIWVLDRKSVV